MKKFFFCIVLFLGQCYLACALQHDFGFFYHFDTDDGLMANRLTSITCDSVGYVWASGNFGIERYDGQNVKHFKFDEYDAMGRVDVMFVEAVSRNRLFGGGYNGQLFMLDVENDSLVDCSPAEQDIFNITCHGVFETTRNEIFAYTSNGIFRFDSYYKIFDNNFEAYSSLRKMYVRALFIDKLDRFWIGSYDRIYLFDKHGILLRTFGNMDETRGAITSISMIDGDKILATTFGECCYLIDAYSDALDCRKIELPFNNSTDFAYSDSTFWFATDGYGLWHTNTLSDKNSFYKITPYGYSSDEINKIYSLTTDRSGNVWFGTLNSGLWGHRSKLSEGILFSGEFGFPNAVCTAFAEDENNQIYIASDGKGLYQFDSESLTYKNYNIGNNNLLAITSLGKSMAIATWGNGIIDFDISSHKLTDISPSKVCEVRNFFGINRFGDTKLWCSSAGNGIYIFDKEWKKFPLIDQKTDTTDNWIYEVYEGIDNTLWVISSNSVWNISKLGCRVAIDNYDQTYMHLPLVFNDILVLNDGSVLVATNRGLYLVNKRGSAFSKLDFTPEDDFRSLLKCGSEIWTTSNKGISVIDFENKKFRRIDINFNDFSRFYFYPRSRFIDHKGDIYFGTNGGFITFDPDNLNPENKIQHIGFGDIKIAGKKIKPSNDIFHFDAETNCRTMVIDYNQSDIDIAFDVIDQNIYDKVISSYRIVGLDGNWHNLENTRNIHINHIAYGDYTLEIRAMHKSKPDDARTISMAIIVTPPWWLTTWFRIAIIIFAILLIILIWYLRVKSMIRQQNYLTQKVAERTQELDAALSEKDRLISVVAHDLKNPMFAIEGALNNLVRNPEDATLRHIEPIYHSAQTLQRKMQQLLDWANSSRTEIVYSPADIDLKDSIDKVLLVVQPMIDKKGISIKTDIDLKNYTFADIRMVETAIQNVVTNAIKFTANGGEIRITARQDDTNSILSVADSGVGMSPQQLSKLQSDSHHTSTLGTNNESGSGLGVNISRNYILKNHGSIEFDSIQGRGTTVRISLPVSQKVIDRNITEPIIDSPMPELDPVIAESIILIVDDDQLILQNLQKSIGQYATVFTADNGRSALTAIEQAMPDIVLVDVEMPDINGFELCDILNKSENTRHIPILFISAKNDNLFRIEGLRRGAIDYICKPFSICQLMIKINNILAVRRFNQKHIIDNWLTNTNLPDADKIQNSFLQHFMELIEENFADGQFSIDELAEKLSVSRSTLNRRIRSLTGKTAIDILGEYRLEAARKQLADPSLDLSISEIAFRNGFNDPAYFSKKFRDQYGYSPSKIGK